MYLAAGVNLKNLFNSVDVDGSGSIDREELALLSRTLGTSLDEDELDEAMAQMVRQLTDSRSSACHTQHDMCLSALYVHRTLMGRVTLTLRSFVSGGIRLAKRRASCRKP